MKNLAVHNGFRRLILFFCIFAFQSFAEVVDLKVADRGVHRETMEFKTTYFALGISGPYELNLNGKGIRSIEWWILFVEDRYQSTGYATRNAVHWPISILGTIN